MPDLTPVDNDPFQTGPTLTPVEHDPWAAGDADVAAINARSAWPNNAAGDQEAQANLAAQGPATPSIGQIVSGIARAPGRMLNSAIDTAIAVAGDPVGAVQDATLGPIKRLMDANAVDTANWGAPPTTAGPGAETAMMLAGAGAPMAEVGAAGIFGGKLMKTADQGAIDLAKKMEAQGRDPPQIWKVTGTAKGADGQWRQEIDDSQAKLKIHPADIPPAQIDPDSVSRTGDFAKTTYLDDVLHHPELYKAYPYIKDLEVAPLPADLVAKGFRGDFDGTTIRINPALSADEAKSTILHEVQHSVQRAEGFARGDSPVNHIPAALAPAESAFNQVKAQTESEVAKNLGTNQSGVNIMKAIVRGDNLDDLGVAPGHQQVFRQILDQNPDVQSRLQNIVNSEKLISDAHDRAFVAYKRSMGETESRNVQKRIDMTAAERRAAPPVTTEDTPRFLQRDSRPKLTPVDHNPFAE